MQRARKDKYAGGFTLLELLAALALVAVLAGSLFTALHLGFQARRRSQESFSPARLFGLALELLSRDLQSAPPPRGILAGPFTGDTAETTFFTRPMRTTTSAVGIVMVSYALDTPEPDGDAVLVRRVTANLLAVEQPEPVEEVLCRDVLSFELAYYDGLNWLETWDSVTMADTLPRAVQVSLRIRAGEQEHDFRRVFLLPASEAVPLEQTSGGEDEPDE